MSRAPPGSLGQTADVLGSMLAGIRVKHGGAMASLSTQSRGKRNVRLACNLERSSDRSDPTGEDVRARHSQLTGIIDVMRILGLSFAPSMLCVKHPASPVVAIRWSQRPCDWRAFDRRCPSQASCRFLVPRSAVIASRPVLHPCRLRKAQAAAGFLGALDVAWNVNAQVRVFR